MHSVNEPLQFSFLHFAFATARQLFAIGHAVSGLIDQMYSFAYRATMGMHAVAWRIRNLRFLCALEKFLELLVTH